MGGSLPTRVARGPTKAPHALLAGGDVAELHDEFAAAVWRSVTTAESDRLNRSVDSAIGALRTRLDTAREQQPFGEARIRERLDELMSSAKELDQLAKRLDWMLLCDRDALARG